MITTQSALRVAFWQDLDAQDYPAPTQRRGRRTQNDYPADVRCAFVDYVDMLARSGEITAALAQRVTL